MVIQVNPYQHNWLTKEYQINKEKIVTIPNGFNPKKIKKTKKDNEKFKIVYLGRIQKYKGLDQIIKTLPSLGKEAEFHAIGPDAGFQNKLNLLARELKVKKQVFK